MKAFKDITGQRFGRLVVTGIYKRATHGKPITWNCICDCGKEYQVLGTRLRKGTTQSCGCLQRELSAERAKARMKTHGKTRTRLYSIWASMKNRCYCENNTHFNYYGGRGIKICEEWLTEFMSFYNWAINNGYQDELTLDRINVDGDYSPDNCRWITMKQQGNNRRNNHLLNYGGRVWTLTELAEDKGIQKSLLYERLRRGWDLERALTQPVKAKNIASEPV